MPVLLLLFIALPIVELMLLLEIGERLGGWPTVGLVIATGVLGAALAHRQGLATLARIQAEVEAGRVPGHTLAEGVMILAAGILLVTPGVLTDALGLLCLFPPTRRLLLAGVLAGFERAVRRGDVHVSTRIHVHRPAGPEGEPRPGGGLRDLDPDEYQVRNDEAPRLGDAARGGETARGDDGARSGHVDPER